MKLLTKAVGLFSHNVYYVKLRLPYNKFMESRLDSELLVSLVDNCLARICTAYQINAVIISNVSTN